MKQLIAGQNLFGSLELGIWILPALLNRLVRNYEADEKACFVPKEVTAFSELFNRVNYLVFGAWNFYNQRHSK